MAKRKKFQQLFNFLLLKSKMNLDCEIRSGTGPNFTNPEYTNWIEYRLKKGEIEYLFTAYDNPCDGEFMGYGKTDLTGNYIPMTEEQWYEELSKI